SDLVIYLGTFSKILSPGLRLRWAVAPPPGLGQLNPGQKGAGPALLSPPPGLAKLNPGKQGAALCSSPVTQMFVAAYFHHGGWLRYVETLRDLYRTRRDAMIEALEEHFG